ncbi:unnamed protein product [Paramecium primaurelia]|uniref:Uncharacterized protein n=1 Tax=Paramecium primaurelia TaxID=5886 RepID=A0A8S1KSY9_PARPR|nr:unnamed protein product [Paramecium primaurelia]
MYCTFQEKEALADIFTQVKDVDEQIFGVILKIFRKKKTVLDIFQIKEISKIQNNQT